MRRIGAKRTTGWKATIAVAMSNYIEAGSIIAIATSLTFWQAEFGFSDGFAGILAALSANAFGAAIGAIVGGPLCDRLGRKFIYTYDLAVYMFGALLAAFAMDQWTLLAAFVITGIAVGAGVPASWTYIAEEAPADKRAAHVGMAQLAWSVGPMIGFLLAAALGPLGLFGARLIFVHLFLVALATWWMRQGLEESQRWKDSRASATPGPGGLRALFRRRRNITALLFLIGVYGFWNTVAGQAGIFMPRVYEAAGLADPQSQFLLQALLWSFTVVGTYFGFMRFADTISRRLLFIVGAVLGISGWVVLVYVPASTGSMLAFAALWGFASGIGAQAFYGLWAAELFSTRFRASAQGLLFFTARIMVGILSYGFPLWLTSMGLPGLGALLIGLLTISLIVGALWAPNTQGLSLDDIERERHDTRADAAVS